MSLRTAWAPAVSAVAVAALVGGVSVALSGRGADGPPPLRLAAGGTADSAAASSERRPGGYRLVGTLPAGPGTARVHELGTGPAPVQRVRDLAGALGIDEAPERVVRAWRAGALVVRDDAGHPWSYGHCGPDSAVSSDGSTSCSTVTVSSDGGSAGGGTEPHPGGTDSAVATAPPPPATAPSAASTRGSVGPPSVPCVARSPGTRAAPPCLPAPPLPCGGAVGKGGCLRPGPAMTVEQALAATERLRSALGLLQAEVRALTHPGGATLTADPRVAGLRTRGIAVVLDLGADRRLRSASGWLAEGRAGASYPLVSARAALDRLGATAVGVPCQEQACPTAPAVEGADLGLLLTPLQDARAALLPAWLLELAGSDEVVAQLAVREDSLEQPDEPPSDSPATQPAGPEPDPAADREPLAFDAAIRTDEPGALSVRYSSVCTSGVTGVAKESADTVVVLLEQDPQPQDRACIAMYAPAYVALELAAPLGRRTVIDGNSGRPVPVVRCPDEREMCP